MVDDVTGKKGTTTTDIFGAGSTSATGSADGTKAKNKAIGKDEFLNLLVTQLKNQDPLDPMKNEEFAVNLAQFSQLEQLMSINNKIGGTDTTGGGLSSLAGYLGHEVTLDADTIHVDDEKGGTLKMTLPVDVRELNVELLDKDGKTVETLKLGEVPAGEHKISLEGISSPNGDYQFKTTAIGVTGGQFDPHPTQVGVVSGFIPGADPKLIVNGQEVSPSNIKQVNLVASSPTTPGSGSVQ